MRSDSLCPAGGRQPPSARWCPVYAARAQTPAPTASLAAAGTPRPRARLDHRCRPATASVLAPQSHNATNVFTAEPKIAEVRPASANSMFVFGVAPGTTTVAALDTGNGQRDRPVSGHRRTLRTSMPPWPTHAVGHVEPKDSVKGAGDGFQACSPEPVASPPRAMPSAP